MNYTDALNLMHEYTKSDSLRKHMYAVESVMRAYARKYNDDEEKWAIAGVLHDFDYEMFPTIPDHPLKGSEILKTKGYPDDIRYAILGHASFTNVKRETLMAKVLYACDELCGFITAVAVIRPNKISDLQVSSVKKKLKDKAFAKNVSREDIDIGIKELGVPLEDHIRFVIEAMKADAEKLGLEP
ncbi:MAG: HD domain-containing protein [Calditrichaeota bacterium]|nr:MAG: HD domain-containing protein [Calditrichota bacterium]